jgi:hypothetical protein
VLPIFTDVPNACVCDIPNPVPVIVRTTPPKVLPVDGEIEEIVGVIGVV